MQTRLLIDSSMLKKTVISFIVALLLFTTLTYGQKDFSNLSTTADSLYGYIPQNPLRLKNGNPGKSIVNSYNLVAGLQTLNGQNLTFLFRSSMPDPNHKDAAIKLYNRFTGLPLNGKLGRLDKYVFLTSTTKDTITLFVDIYNKGGY